MKHKSTIFVLALGVIASVFILGFGTAETAGLAQSTAEQAQSTTASWTSILPPLVAIGIALVFRQVLFALFLGIWCGAFLAGDMSFIGIFTSFFTALSQYIVDATADASHMSIIIFTLLIGGMVGVITDNGGTRGVIKAITRYVRTKVHGQLITALMGFIVFFDDYANTMVVGNTMRPLTDKLRISRAKLAYLVDATAAPIATVALVSTWIGAMVGFISDAEAKMPNFNEAAYSVFFNSLPYNFYAFFTILFVILIAWSGRDFGTMLKARINLYKAKHDSDLDRYNLYKEKIREDEEKKKESHWINAALPIFTLVFGCIGGLVITGEGSTIQEIIETADSYKALLWGGFLSMVVAIIMTLSEKLLDIEDTLEGMMDGMHTMFDGLLILVLAWALSAITVELNTADFLVSVFGDLLNPFWLPAIILFLSALTSFATGSSWGTMGILMPLVVPLAWEIGNSGGLEFEVVHEIIYASVSAVLAGSVWGDHCSPISDTTILSSIATQCDHVEHVNTQLPYAMIVGSISILAMIGMLVLSIPWWIIYPLGVVLIVAIIFKFGKVPDPADYAPEGREPALTNLDG
ncbi:Na+/H+ antiporter NhaC family protein [Aliifodinibius sp. S!AR15-10]|uniref:Na+/H+ antiporter NhaC family protein n=1 Tax=Aliifodinibius sp. S!AR15-10 TaxID=2950437 RepID=UPI002855BE3F|nr:Na+/H+ antiporter NhaC family protein [Aliifodinibius sp. S!AR15-10]MDR8391914.1 Na+/H+ antiporter NhaC family protein [Aliifodinibius sp. S!AR15-10]